MGQFLQPRSPHGALVYIIPQIDILDTLLTAVPDEHYESAHLHQSSSPPSNVVLVFMELDAKIFQLAQLRNGTHSVKKFLGLDQHQN